MAPIIAIVAVVVVAIVVGAVVIFAVAGKDDDEGGGGEARSNGGATTDAPASGGGMASVGSSTSGFVEANGAVDVPITIEDGVSATLTVTPEPAFDVTITVNGGGYADEYVDVGVSGEPEVFVLGGGDYVVTVAGYAGTSGGFYAELS